MLKKILMLAITSGLAAKLYKSYTGQKRADGGPSEPTARKRSPRTQA